jgi:hypothetical protein
MTDQEQRRTSATPGKIARALHILLFTLALLLVMLVLPELRKANAPGAPAWAVYLLFGASVAVAAALSPVIFWRMAPPARTAARWSVFLPFALLPFVSAQMDASWVKTPEGAKELAQQAAANQRQAADEAERRETQESLTRLATTQKQLEELNEKLEGCFTRFGHRLPALEEPIKEAVHNPRSFEHVETVITLPDDQRNNVQMTFRAENAFGAIRTATVRAQLIADDCSIQNIGEPEVN